ncbi:hypothetical protein DFH08DRAFT_827183 [Mycena albidolilacea]|uniref:Uncharacterized protein n=1 Tax=Mycena albidolilacea TaxID=1033008 RepID=A0AAD7E8D6_9AGAR|nr:hypothetical protein DFH08DRAFT_827183 [Mycena albidolilacea]
MSAPQFLHAGHEKCGKFMWSFRDDWKNCIPRPHTPLVITTVHKMQFFRDRGDYVTHQDPKKTLPNPGDFAQCPKAVCGLRGFCASSLIYLNTPISMSLKPQADTIHCIQALPRHMLRPRRLGSARWTQGHYRNDLYSPQLRLLLSISTYGITALGSGRVWSAGSADPASTHRAIARRRSADIITADSVATPRLSATCGGAARQPAPINGLNAVIVAWDDGRSDWQMGAHMGRDYWSRAERFIALRRSGEIDGVASILCALSIRVDPSSALRYEIPNEEHN